MTEHAHSGGSERVSGLGTCSKCDDHNKQCICRMACPKCQGTGSSRLVLVGNAGDGDCPNCGGLGAVFSS